MTRILCQVGCLVFALIAVCAAQAVKITIRVLDSKTGNVLYGRDSYNSASLLLFDEQGRSIPIQLNEQALHQQGGETRDVQNAAAVEIFPDGYLDCRKIKKRGDPHYSVDEIVKYGIVTENRCTKRTVPQSPGVIVLFVRKPNWYESLLHE
jgi:hypothetical protein